MNHVDVEHTGLEEASINSTHLPDECKTILVVEDSRDTRKMLMLLLQTRIRARILGASEGTTALHLACQERPDLILMDIMLPEMDGLETTRRLKAEPATAHIPVVAVSDLCLKGGWEQKALAAGCARCMSKLQVLDNVSDLINLVTAALVDEDYDDAGHGH